MLIAGGGTCNDVALVMWVNAVVAGCRITTPNSGWAFVLGLALKTLCKCLDAPEGLYLSDILWGRGGVGVVDARLWLVD